MWWRRSWLSLNGTIGIQGQDRAKGALSYATQLLSTSQPIPAPRWRSIARAYGGASGDRGGRGGSRAQPHAGAGTPDLRPHGVIWAGVGLSAAAPLIPAPRWGARHIERGSAPVCGSCGAPWSVLERRLTISPSFLLAIGASN